MSSQTQYSIDAPATGPTVRIDIEDGYPRYSISVGGTTLLDPSGLGLELADVPDLTGPFEVVAADHDTGEESWEPVWGKAAEIEEAYTQFHLRLRETGSSERLLELTFRVFEDGVGFRYTIPEQENIEEFAIAAERSEFRFAEDFTAWWIPAHETGPKPCSWIDTYEKIYTESPLSQTPRVHTPVTIETEECYLALHEAALIDYADMEPAPIEGESHAFESGLVALPDDTKVRGTAPHRSPWRTLLVGENPGDLIESHVIEALNEPCAIEDPSWIDPGTYVGVWWELHKGVSTWEYGPNVGANTENTKEYIDFAAEHDIPYVLAEGWNEGWGPDPATTDFARANDRFDLDEILAYAAERDVQFLAHAETNGNVEAFEEGLEETFQFYERNGIPGVKTGYAGDVEGHHRHDQWMVNHYRRTVRAAADHDLMIDIHEPIKPTGERRTYPNLMTREGVRGMEINASPSLGGGNPPAHTVTLPFTRMVAGPLDYTPGIFEVLWDPSENGTRVHTTRARQLALYLDETPHLSTTADDEQADERAEPDVSVYSDMLLLIDALEREDPTTLDAIETPDLVNLYTLLSDVQRNANDLRKDVTDVLLDRVQHDRPAHGQYGSVQRTTRRQRSLKDDETVLDAFEDTGIDREQVLGVDRGKVDEALDVVPLSESAVYDIEESEYVRKAEVDEERKETRLQGLKDRLAVSDDPEAEVLRQEVDRLEGRIEDLTEFSPGSAFADGAE